MAGGEYRREKMCKQRNLACPIFCRDPKSENGIVQVFLLLISPEIFQLPQQSDLKYFSDSATEMEQKLGKENIHNYSIFTVIFFRHRALAQKGRNSYQHIKKSNVQHPSVWWVTKSACLAGKYVYGSDQVLEEHKISLTPSLFEVPVIDKEIRKSSKRKSQWKRIIQSGFQ